jgi:hypothetical protein
MSRTLFNRKKVITFLMALVLLVTLMRPFIAAEGPEAFSSSKVTKNSKKQRKVTMRSGTEILSEVMDIISLFGGDAVGNAIDEFSNNIQQTASLLQSLASDDTIDSINFLIRNSLSSFSEAAKIVASKNDITDSVQSSDFGEFLEIFKTTLLERCQKKSNFSGAILPQLEIALPHILEGLSEMYRNVVEVTSFHLTFGLLSQGTSFLTLLERPQYVSKETFSQFVSFPEEIKHQFETVIEELVKNYVDPAQLEMMLNMAKMYATNFSSRRAEHEDL